MGIVDALRNGKVEYTGKSANNVKISVGNGNSNISVKGNNVDITTGTGNQNVVVLGNDVDIKLDQNASSDWDFENDFDHVGVISDKGNVNINTGDGNDLAIAIADNLNIEMGNGNHSVDFWGDDVNINLGNGDSSIHTLDKSIANGSITENTTWNLGFEEINIGKAAVSAIENDTVVKTANQWEEYNTEDKNGFLQNIKNTYNLDNASMSMIEKLYDSGELFATFTNNGKTYPRYSIMKSVTQKNANGSAKNILCYNDYTVGSEGMHTRGLIETKNAVYGSTINVGGKTYGFAECVATKDFDANQSYTIEETKDVYTEQYYQLDGSKNLKIHTGNSNTNIIDVTAQGTVDIETGDIVDPNVGYGNLINVDASVRTETEVVKNTVKTGNSKTVHWGINRGGTYTSPLIFDTNKDGKVSAKSGNGVDVNNDGIADGYASDGDKMLAMSDINSNGAVDGNEVFGNNTVSPFTGKPLNAANGFEALKLLAQQAEHYTNIKCYNNGQVNLAALKSALATVGVNLGYISDSNTNKLEDLESYDIASVSVDNYNETEQTGDVQHRQQGSYTSADGSTHSVDDVWFRNRNVFDKMRDGWL